MKFTRSVVGTLAEQERPAHDAIPPMRCQEPQNVQTVSNT